MTDEDGLRLEAAKQFGFESLDDTPSAFSDWTHFATEAQIIAFAKACEMAGRREAMRFVRRELNNPLSARDKSPLKAVLGALTKLNNATLVENAPILEAVRAKTLLCKDEGCPHHGTDHVCVSSAALVERLQRVVDHLEDATTLPKPYDFYRAVKNDGQGTGWRYECVGIGIEDIKETLVLLKSQQPAIDILRRLYEVATNELRNTSQLLSNPPQSAAAWDIRNAISKEIEKVKP